MTDFASLGIKIDSTQAKQAAGDLDRLAVAGARAEASTTGLAGGFKGAGAEAAAMASAAQLSARAAMDQAAGFGAATSAARLNTLAMRETLVVAREISRGNFTRLPGSLTLLAQGIGSQGGIGAYAAAIAQQLGLIKKVQNAELAEAATAAANAAAGVEAAARKAAANVMAADTEIALAEAQLRVTAGTSAEAVAQVRLAAAHEAVAAAAAEAAVAENALAVAQGRSAEAGAASAAASRTGLGGAGVGLIGLAAVAGVAYAAIKQLQDQIKDDGALTDYRNNLGLTHAEMLKLSDGTQKVSKNIKELTDVTPTFGDVMHGVWQTVSGEIQTGARDTGDALQKMGIDTSNSWEVALGTILSNWIGTTGAMEKNAGSTFSDILTLWDKFSAALSAGFWSLGDVAKLAFKGVGQVISDALHGNVGTAVSELGGAVTALLPGMTTGVGLTPGGAKALNGLQAQADANMKAALAQNAAAAAAIRSGAEQNAKDRMKAEADALKADRTPKKDRKQGDHGLAEALAELDAQIKGQLALAAAYQVSDAAAMRAEAMQKAEEQAIRHKGEVGVFYEKELALAVATRIAQGEKAALDMNYEAGARKQLNDAVAAGTMTMAQANEQLKLELGLRPLKQAYENAEPGMKAAAAKAIRDYTSAQKDSNVETSRAQVLAATASGKNQLEQLQLEATLIGQTNAVRAVAIAQLQAEQFLRDHPGTSLADALAYVQTQKDIAQQTADNATAQENWNKQLTATADILALIDERAQSVATALGDAFGQAGQGIGQALTALTHYSAVQAQLQAQHDKNLRAAGKDEKAIILENQKYQMASDNNRLAGTIAFVGGLKTMFKEHSVGYRAMAAAEKALAVIQAIQTIKSIAAGAAKMFSQLGVWAFPAVAAMVAVMAGFGFSGGSSTQTAPTSPDDLQKAAGTGTVLGSPKDQSASIAHSLELVAKNTNDDLQYSNAMLIALRSIDTSIGAMAASVAKQINVNGSLFDTTKLSLGQTGSSGFLGLFATSKTRTLYDAGITLAATTVGNIVASGIAGSTYQIVEQVKKSSGFLGIGGGTRTTYSTTTGALPTDITGAIQSVIGALENGLVAAAKIVGIDGAKALIDGFQVDLGKISFNGMDGKAIEDELNAIFSSVGDKMAQALFPALASMQKVGEGLFETFVRVAKEYETVDVELRSIGRSFGAVGVNSIAARDALVQLFGSLDNFVTATDTFRDKFLTQAEQIAPIQASVIAELKRLGESGITTRDQFKSVVLGLDLTTDAGRQMYASLLAVAPAFDKVLSYFDSLNKTTVDGLQKTIDQFNQFADTLKKYRDTLFDTGATQAATTAILKAKFDATAALAGNGDATALGNLQNDAKSYLDSAKLSAGSYIEYQRALAQVAAGVDKGIFAAESTADYAQLQLDALKNATTILQGINANTAAMVDALHSPPVITSPVVIAPVATGPDAPVTQADIQALKDEINAGLTAIAISSQTTAKVLYNASNGDYLRIGNDPDTGLTVLP